MKFVSALVLSTTLAFAGAALANEHAGADQKGGKPGHHGGMFKKLDTNGDGVITKEEHQAHADKMFSKMDANGDGKVTQAEAKVGHDKMRAKWKEHHAEKGTASMVKKGDSSPKAN